MHKLNQQSVTTEQLNALVNVQANVGRTWKHALSTAWSNGYYQDICFDRSELSELQTLRNLHGPCWLALVTSSELKRAWATYCANK